MLKLAITGKGGVGKTTLSALLAHVFAERGQSVLAIDADPATGLAAACGVPQAEAAAITPVADMEELIYERTGARKGEIGGFFKLNPRVDDIPDRFSVVSDGIRILTMGTVKAGGTGCLCPENALLRSLVTHLLLRRGEVLILDMEAGIEHLGRGTAEAVDALLVVVEPGRRSLQTAHTIAGLARDLRIKRLYAVGNKIRSPEDEAFIAGELPEFEILGFLPSDADAIEADRQGVAVFEMAPALVERVQGIVDRLTAM
ncbi:MAG TPA: carbon monoxide dehydrogenase accessory protein CooC [Anaerolineae bacterium]|nr:carbon monoxide dehydrogenase accessory protein CooC [Anaerolineae bacterium]